MILMQQVSELCEDIKGDVTNGQAGTDSTLFVKSQTGLQAAVAATEVALSDKTNTKTSVFVNHIITTSLGNGNTLVEFEVNNGVVSYNRAVKSGVAKTSFIELNVFHNFLLEVVP